MTTRLNVHFTATVAWPIHNWRVIRRLAFLPLSLALLLTLFMAPYQHVHLATYQGQDPDDHDDDSAVVHIHFYTVHAPTNHGIGTGVDSADGDKAQALDTFTTVPQAGFPALTRPASRLLLFPPSDFFRRVVELTEPRGHDPPFFEFAVPRAPPL
jgi:hypothetical protein